MDYIYFYYSYIQRIESLSQKCLYQLQDRHGGRSGRNIIGHQVC